MAEEAKDYFANIDDHRRYFKWSGEIDSRALEVCFAKDKWNARKIWIMRTMSLQAHIENEEFSRFVIKDLLGSVPSMMDGLKTTQRKVLFAAMEDLKEKKQGEASLWC